MNKTGLTKFFLVIVIVFILGIVSCTVYRKITNDAVYKYATLYIVMGSAKISEDGSSWEEVENGEELEEGLYIKTESGSRATVVFPDNSITRLDENTTIQLQEIYIDKDNTQINIFLETGRIWSRVIEFITTDESEFSVETSDSVAMVRGTIFGAEKGTEDSQDRSLFYTIKSKIILIDKLSQNELEVEEGYYSNEVIDGTIVKGQIPSEWYQRDWFKYSLQSDEDLDTFFEDKDMHDRLLLRNSYRFIDFRQFVFGLQNVDESINEVIEENQGSNTDIGKTPPIEEPLQPFITITYPTSTPCTIDEQPISGTIGGLDGLLRPEVVLTITQKGLYWNGNVFASRPNTVTASFSYDGLSWFYELPDYSYIEIKADFYAYKDGARSLLSTAYCE